MPLSRIILLASLLGACAVTLAQSSEKYSAEEVRQDLDTLYASLQASHFDLFANLPQAEYDRAYRDLRARVTDDSLTLLQVYRILQPFVARSGMGHASLDYPFARLYGTYVGGGGTLFPLNLHMTGKEATVSGNYTGRADILRGDKVISIDGLSMTTVTDSIYRYLSGESDYYKGTLVDMLSFPRLHWILFTPRDSFEVVLRRSAGSMDTLNLMAIPAMTFEEQLGPETEVLEPGRTFWVRDSVAYIQPGPFMNAEGSGNTSEVASFDRGEFARFVDSAFTDITAAGANHLILDLRNNGGGSNTFSDYMLAYVSDRPFRFASRFEVRTSRITKDFWRHETDSTLLALKEAILTQPNGARFEWAIPLHEPRPVGDRFTGKVYTLINRYSYSQATVTAAMIQDYGFGTLIGESTADVPSNYGSVHQFTLPHTGIAVSYPKAFFVRPGGDPAQIGTAPDILVESDRQRAEDEVLQAVLHRIRQRP